MTETSHPYARTRAATMLEQGIRTYTDHTGFGLRVLAAELGIKQAASLSQMTTGRIGIPLDRAVQLATKLDLDVPTFCLAVFEQRAPEATKAIEQRVPAAALAKGSREVAELVRAISSASDLDDDRVKLLRELLECAHPRERLLFASEAAIGATLREYSPGALSIDKARQVAGFVELALD